DVTGATRTIVADNVFISNQFGGTKIRQRVVRTTTLDEQLHGNDGPDMIKIDVEGADLAALEGGRRMLECYLPIIFCEATNFKETKTLLENLGYKLFNGTTLQALDVTGAYDVVALHRDKHLEGWDILAL